jgi:hypothetical protein
LVPPRSRERKSPTSAGKGRHAQPHDTSGLSGAQEADHGTRERKRARGGLQGS